MNGVHDMGGMHGFGPVQAEANEPVFHAQWEARVFALSSLMGAWRKWNLDAFRYSVERLPPADYLRMSYFERWLASLVTRSIDAALVTSEEIGSGRMAVGLAPQSPPMTAAELPAVLSAGNSTQRSIAASPRFGPGAVVRAKNIHPTSHTRLPRYVRGRLGVIERDHGAHVLPDSNAHYRGENPQTLYTVRFAARELWGDAANPADAIYLDLWEDYLDPQ
jgi:nitrile hydratase beta subunit